MNGSPHLIIHTISPIRAPICTHSEQRVAQSLANSYSKTPINESLCNILVGPYLSPKPIGWANGYGTLGHDNLPDFFLPLLCREVNLDMLSAPNSLLVRFLNSWQGRVLCCEIYFYDDTVALLKLDIGFDRPGKILDEGLLNGDIDGQLSDVAKEIYQQILFPEFYRYCKEFKELTRQLPATKLVTLLDPKKLRIFKDVDFCLENKKTDNYVLWTGRHIIVSPEVKNTALGNVLCKWGSCDTSRVFSSEESFHLGSGNILVFSHNPETCGEDWFRGLLICQYYNAILMIYSGILKTSYSNLNITQKTKRLKGRWLDTLMQDITFSLDHLEFSRLEFNDARAGVQAARARIVEATRQSWHLDTLTKSLLERTDLVRARLSRLQEQRRTVLNRSVEFILTAIGGITIIDLFVSLVNTSRSLTQDNIPGLFDIFRLIQPDTSMNIAIILVVLLSTYVFIAKR